MRPAGTRHRPVTPPFRHLSVEALRPSRNPRRAPPFARLDNDPTHFPCRERVRQRGYILRRDCIPHHAYIPHPDNSISIQEVDWL